MSTSSALNTLLSCLQPKQNGRLDLMTSFMQDIGPGWKNPGKTYRFFELLIVFSGEGIALADSTPVLLRKGSVFLTGPGVAVTGKFEKRTLRIASFHFDLAGAKQFSKKPVWDHFYTGTIDEIEKRCIAIAAHPAEKRLREVILEEILLLLAADDTEKGFDSRLYPVIKHIEYYKGKEHCSIRELCDIAGSSPRHLNRLFRAATGQSPLDYCLTYRIALARNMLLDKGAKVQAVASELGYTDVFLFIRQFKKITGRTPKQYQMAQ